MTPNQKSFKKIVVALISLGFSLSLTASVQAQEANASSLNSEASLTVNTGKTETSQFKRYLSINGTVSAWQEVVIAPEVGGYRVEEVFVDIGDTVTKGQPLVRLSSSLLATERASSLANLKQREAENVNASLALDRAKSLTERNLLSTSDFDRLTSEALGAQARLEAARADLEAAELRFRFASVVAPDDGVITARDVSVGQLAQAGGEMLRLLRQNRVEWRGEVPEQTLPSLQAGQTVLITGVDGSNHVGIIRIVSPTVNPNTHNGMVYVDINSTSALRPGMFARGRIEFAEVEAMMIPMASIISSDGYNYVFVVQSDRTVRRQLIETGVLQGDKIEVLNGLKPDESIVTNGAGFLKDGDLVNVVDAR